MPRAWKPPDFDSVYERFICRDEAHLGGRAYHRRYRSRYRECTRRFAALAPPEPVDVLDIGGGQLALMCAKLWNDRAVVADLPGPHLLYMAEHGVEVMHWNLCNSEPPCVAKFDFVFFSEVIEHLPIPGYIVLERIRRILRPGGVIICTTPNLYRLRNLVYMALGRTIFDHFQYPDTDVALSHVLEYSRDHLDWQFKKAGFTECRVEYSQMQHSPTNPLFRPMAWLGYPLHIIPRWRDNLVATARAPVVAGQPRLYTT
ncbi:MAG TPA: class I SAM-dependent methyltransferase [Candidatus Angelobacter sp.]|nr:class I SAM-dependent methyltransferase [Candidatus Angelobacter sp.]